MHLEAGAPRVFPPIVATHLVKLACELPEDEARSLSTWTCAELARTLIRDHIVDTISPSSVQRLLASEKLKPWRVPLSVCSDEPPRGPLPPRPHTPPAPSTPQPPP